MEGLLGHGCTPRPTPLIGFCSIFECYCAYKRKMQVSILRMGMKPYKRNGDFTHILTLIRCLSNWPVETKIGLRGPIYIKRRYSNITKYYHHILAPLLSSLMVDISHCRI